MTLPQVARAEGSDEHGAGFMTQLRTRLIVTALIAVVPALLATVYLQAVERREATQRIGPETLRLVRLAADEYSGTLVGARHLLRTLAVIPTLASSDTTVCRSVMSAVLRSHPGYVNLAVANLNGGVECSAVPMRPELVHSAVGQTWFDRAIATGQSSLGDVQTSATTGRPAVLLGEPVFDRQHRVVHVLVATLDLEALSGTVETSAIPPRSMLTMFTASGIVLARTPQDTMVGKRILDSGLVARAIRRADAGSGDERMNRDGVRRLYTTTAVSDFPGLYVSLGVEHGAAYAEVDRIIRRYVALLAFGVVAAMIAAFFGGQAFVVRPVLKLQRVMRQLAAGDFSARASLHGAAYGLAGLGEAVNVMAESLEQRYQERATAEDRLQATEDRLRFALEAANVGIWEADLASGRTYWSVECQRMHGLVPGTFGNTVEAFIACVHPDDRREVQQATEAAAESGSVTTFTYRTIWPGGAIRVITTTARFVFENSRPVRGAGVALDVTDRQHLEEQLRHAQKMEAVGQLAGGVAHDFNNLLTIILGNTEILAADRAATPELEEVRRAAMRAAELTRQLLAFSRKQTLALKPTDVGIVVDELVPMLHRLIGEDIEVRSIRRESTLVALVDRSQFEQAIINVAVNARDAMPAGGVLAIDVGTRVIEAAEIAIHDMGLRPGPHVAITMSDTGEGMTPDVLAHAFEPFFTTKEVGRGTGLGLSSVYGTVKQCGGHVTAASEPGVGTTLTIYLPLVERAPHESARGCSAATAPVRPKTILVVEDDPGVCALATRVLSSAGYQVLSAASGDDALREARSYPGVIDLIVSDVVMPGMPVDDMIAALHASRPGVPVLMTSGYPDDDLVRRRIATSTMELLQKPYDSAELLARVAVAIRDAEARCASSRPTVAATRG